MELPHWFFDANTEEEAELRARSQAEQQGHQVESISATGGANGMWDVVVTVKGSTLP